MGVFDVPTDKLIESIAIDLKQEFKIEQPEFLDYVKTGAHRERQPQRKDWFYVRMGSVLYRVFKDGPVGVNSLRTYYGGKKNRGVKPHRFTKASGKVLRTVLQSLEKAGLIQKDSSKKGRVISGKGHSFLVKKSKLVEANLKKSNVKKEQPKPVEVKTEQKQVEQSMNEKKVEHKKSVEKKEEVK